jgi:chorismate mutase
MTTVARPTREEVDATDEDRLEEVLRRAKDLFYSDKLTRELFEEIWAEGLKATGGHEGQLGTLAMYRPRA